MTTTPSAGAVRAAEKIAEAGHFHTDHSSGDKATVAAIIDKETGLADLVEAAQAALKYVQFSRRTSAWDETSYHKSSELESQLQTALAKHQG